MTGEVRRISGAGWYPQQPTRQSQERVPVLVTMRCGHEEEHQIYGDPMRSRWVVTLQAKACRACELIERTQGDDAEVLKGNRCALEGSEKQVTWAQSLRQRRAESLNAVRKDMHSQAQLEYTAKRLSREVGKALLADVDGAILELMHGTIEVDLEEGAVVTAEARFWIDTRPRRDPDGNFAGLSDRELLGILIPHRDFTAGDDLSDWSMTYDMRKAPAPARRDESGFDDEPVDF